MQRFIALLITVGVFDVAIETPAAVMIDSVQTVAGVAYPDFADFLDLPTLGPATVISGDYSSTSEIFLSTVGDSTIMSASFDQARQGVMGSLSIGFISVDFTPDVDVHYTAAGTYSNSAGRTYLEGTLFEIDTALRYRSIQISHGIPDAFTLGGSVGNYDNDFDGSLTGKLLAGHHYTWYAQVHTWAYDEDDEGATADGSVSLTLSPVPEFSSLIVWSLLAVSIGGFGWRHRPKPAALKSPAKRLA